MKNSMYTSTIGIILIILGIMLLFCGSLPMENKVEDNKLVVKYIIGKNVIDLSQAVFLPIPEECNDKLIRVGGTSIGKKRSGYFRSRNSGNKYQLFISGKGKKSYFEIGDERYLVDGIE